MSKRNDQVELVIEAGRTESQYWQDLWQYRELFYFLAWRDILVRYKQTAIGIAWALIRHWLRWYDRSGNWIPTPAEQERQGAEQKRLAERLRQLGVDPDG